MLLIKNADVYTPKSIGRRDVLLDSTLLALSDSIHLTPESGLATDWFDAEGLILIPGLVDALVHYTGGGGEAGFASRTPPLKAEQAWQAGVTSMVGCLGTDAITRSHVDLLATARGLSEQGVNAWCLTGSYAVPTPTLTGSVERDLVLIPEIIGVGELALGDHRGSQPVWQDVATIAAASRRGAMLAGKLGTLLLHLGDADQPLAIVEQVLANTELPRSLFYPTHCNRTQDTFDACLKFALAGGAIDFTTSTTPSLIESGEVPAAEALALGLDANVDPSMLTMSSDGQASLPCFNADQELVDTQVACISSLWQSVQTAVKEHGVPFEHALASVTANPARVMGLNAAGRIQPGAPADLLLLDPESLALMATISGGVIRWQNKEARLRHRKAA